VPARHAPGLQPDLIPNPRDIPKFVEVLKKRPFHMLPAVNTLFNALLQNPEFRRSISRSCARRPAAWRREGTARSGSRSRAAP
jgi:hypothetical protein